MVPNWLVFCEKVYQVFLSFLPKYAKQILSYFIVYPIKYHVYCYGYFLFGHSINNYICLCVGTIYYKAVCIDITFWFKNSPNSDSVDDTMMILMIPHSTYGPFLRVPRHYWGIAAGLWDWEKHPPDLLCASCSEK